MPCTGLFGRRSALKGAADVDDCGTAAKNESNFTGHCRWCQMEDTAVHVRRNGSGQEHRKDVAKKFPVDIFKRFTDRSDYLAKLLEQHKQSGQTTIFILP